MPLLLSATWSGGATPLSSSNAGHGGRAEARTPAALGVGVSPLSAPLGCSSKDRSERGAERRRAGSGRRGAGGRVRADSGAAGDGSRQRESCSSADLPALPLPRRVLALSGALLPSLGLASRAQLASAAQPGSPSIAAASTGALAGAEAPLTPASAPVNAPAAAEQGALRRPASQVVDMSQWQLVVGEGFVLQVPPGWQDLTPREEEGEAPQSTVMMQNKAPKTPFVARFASPDSAEVISVLLQQASKVKLTFFEVDDVSALGTIGEAAKILVSPGARIVGSREFQSAWVGKRPRTYYLYEYVSAGQHVAMSVSASAGYLFVVGASAPEDKWRPAAARLRAAAGAFQLTV